MLIFGFYFVLIVLCFLSLWTLFCNNIPEWLSIPLLDPLYGYDYSVTNGTNNDFYRQQKKLLLAIKQMEQFNIYNNISVRNRRKFHFLKVDQKLIKH